MNAHSTINVRINTSLKERGDKVLKANGLSTSDAIRFLWSYLARARKLPSFLREALDANARNARKSKRKALDALAGIAPKGTSLTDDQLNAMLIESMVHDYEGLR